jgi:CBS domain-containing protein
MEKDLVTCTPDASLKEISKKMLEHNIGAIVVTDQGWGLQGILTDRDVALFIGSDSHDISTAHASDVMKTSPISVDAGDDIDSAIRKMSEAHVKRLPVTENGKLTGMVTFSDVAKFVREEFDQLIEIEEDYVKR